MNFLKYPNPNSLFVFSKKPPIIIIKYDDGLDVDIYDARTLIY